MASRKTEETKDSEKTTPPQKPLENSTINEDNHNRHQDNELKNLQAQTSKLRQEVEEGKEGKKDDADKEEKKDVPKPSRTLALTPTQQAEFKENSKEDNISVKTETTNLLHVIANQTISNLGTSLPSEGLQYTPLTSYEFQSTKRDAASSFGLTPFRISKDIPQLFKFVARFNDDQQVNPQDLVVTKLSTEGVFEVISESIRLFNTSTMTVRTELNESILDVEIYDPNSIKDGAIQLRTLIPAARQNPQADVNFVESRIFAVLTAFQALNDVLVAMPKKIVCLESVRGGVTAQALAAMPFYEKLHPHPYYSVFTFIPDWARNYFDRAYEKCPLEIGDTSVQAYAGKKLSQWNKIVVDQFTAAILNLNFNKIRNSTMTTSKLQHLIRASMFEKDKLEVRALIEVEELTLLYDYTPMEYDLAMFQMLASTSLKQEVTSFLVEELTKTNRLNVGDLSTIWRGILNADPQATMFNSNWMQSISIGDKVTPYQMIVYETFAEYFEFTAPMYVTPDSLYAIVEIMNIYTFILLFPRISQRMIHILGWKLSNLFKTLIPNIWREYVKIYGDVRMNFGKDVYPGYGKQVTMVESMLGYVYSIFIPYDSSSVHSGPVKTFINMLTSLQNACLPTTKPVELTRKKAAGYPYMYDSYTAYPSWEPIEYHAYETNEITSLGNRTSQIVQASETLIELVRMSTPRTSEIPRAFQTYFTAWKNQVYTLVETCGPPFQLTCAMMQNTLFNSPFYVGSTYNPNPKRFWFVPPSIGIAPLGISDKAAIVLTQRIPVENFKTNIAMKLALTLEGEYSRNTITPMGNEQYFSAESLNTTLRTDITSLNGVECLKMMNSVVCKAKNYGYAMQLTQWMTMPKSPDNPFAKLVEQIAQYMKMAVWAPLIKKIFEKFDVNFNEYFTRQISTSSFIIDGRFLDRCLVLIDPSTGTPQKNQPTNSKFGQKFEYVMSSDLDKMNILCKPLLNMNSKVIYVQNDWYFGRLVVPEMGPTQSPLSKKNWTDETTLGMDLSFERIILKNGQAAQLSYVSDIDKKKRTLILPISADNTNTLLIKMDYTTQIPNQYLQLMATAISYGKVILKVKGMKIRVRIDDKSTQTMDYSVPSMTVSEIHDIISQPNGTIFDRTFISTNYATNFTSNALVVPSYIQWFATEHQADKNIFVSTITNSIVQPSQNRMPLPEEMGYGPDPMGTKFPNNAIKTESNIINWNNCIPTVSTKLLNDIHVDIVPWLPQYQGAI